SRIDKGTPAASRGGSPSARRRRAADAREGELEALAVADLGGDVTAAAASAELEVAANCRLRTSRTAFEQSTAGKDRRPASTSPEGQARRRRHRRGDTRSGLQDCRRGGRERAARRARPRPTPQAYPPRNSRRAWPPSPA